MRYIHFLKTSFDIHFRSSKLVGKSEEYNDSSHYLFCSSDHQFAHLHTHSLLMFPDFQICMSRPLESTALGLSYPTNSLMLFLLGSPDWEATVSPLSRLTPFLSGTLTHSELLFMVKETYLPKA